MRNSRKSTFADTASEPSSKAAFSACATRSGFGAGMNVEDTAFAVSVFAFLCLLLVRIVSVTAMIPVVVPAVGILPVLAVVLAGILSRIPFLVLRLSKTNNLQRRTLSLPEAVFG